MQTRTPRNGGWRWDWRLPLEWQVDASRIGRRTRFVYTAHAQRRSQVPAVADNVGLIAM